MIEARSRPAQALVTFWSHPAHHWIALPCRIWVGTVYILAAWHKILYPAKFALSVATYQILPLEYINAMAIILPWLELVAGLALILGLWTRAAALCMVGMTVMFIVALVIAIENQVQMTSCGCFAPDAEAAMKTIGWDYVYRDVGYLVAASYVALLDPGRLGLDGLWQRWRERRHSDAGRSAGKPAEDRAKDSENQGESPQNRGKGSEKDPAAKTASPGEAATKRQDHSEEET
jgi:uncharacterized membrane protein YphA (DoxX/SURF4 family)